MELRTRLSTGASQRLAAPSISTTPITCSALRGQLLHRMGDPARCRFPRCAPARGHPLAQGAARFALSRRRRRRGGGVASSGCQVSGMAISLAILDLDHAQHGDLGHAAHAVERGALAVDQAFVGHVLEQRLELDLLLPLAARMPARSRACRRVRRIGDEIEDLLAAWAGQAVGLGRSRLTWSICARDVRLRSHRRLPGERCTGPIAGAPSIGVLRMVSLSALSLGTTASSAAPVGRDQPSSTQPG